MVVGVLHERFKLMCSDARLGGITPKKRHRLAVVAQAVVDKAERRLVLFLQRF